MRVVRMRVVMELRNRLTAAWRVLTWPTVVLSAASKRHSGGWEAHNDRAASGSAGVAENLCMG